LAKAIELTILMPCLNEAETLATCIDKAQGFLARAGVAGEVLVADNGSTDGSQDIALAHGARLVRVETRGYGAALASGIAAARGRYVIMGDADDSYDFEHLEPFLEKLRAGSQLVMGNRFKGGIAPGAMPPLHRYLGNPVLSFIGRLFFGSHIGDFHCGLRGFERHLHQRLAQSPVLVVRPDGEGAEKHCPATPRGDRRHAHRGDDMVVLQHHERHGGIMRPALADLVGRAREPARPESLGIDLFDFGVMRRTFRQEGKVGEGHGKLPDELI